LLLEPVFAAIAGYASGERFSALKLVGAGVILAGIALAELTGRRAPPAPHPELEPRPF
jgi:drug/metabolite transporter (DMT)-like permease